MDVYLILRVTKHWAWLLILGILAGGFLGYSYSKREVPVYQAFTQIMISRQPDLQTDYTNPYDDQKLMQTITQIIKTKPILEDTAKFLGYPISAGQIQVVPARDSLLTTIYVEDDNPTHAADIANTLYAVLITHTVQTQKNRFAESEDSLQNQLHQVEDQISSLQKGIDQVSEESLKKQQTDVQNQISTLQANILKLQASIAEMTPKPTAVWGPTPTPNVERDNSLREQQLSLSQMQTSLNFYQQIYLNLMGSGQSGNSNGRVDQMRSTLALYQQIYSNLLANYETVRLSRLRNTPNIEQIEAAEPNPVPIRPKVAPTVIIGAFLGFIMAGCVIALIEFLNDTIRTPDDITRLSNMSVIGFIAKMEHKPKKKNLYVMEYPRSPVSEAFRTLRTNIEFANADSPVQTLLVTSATPGEGKTTISTNLAMVFAQSGKNVLLIDADMRRPKIDSHLGLANDRGFSDVLVHPELMDEIKQHVNDTHLEIITSGPIPENPSELLTSEGLDVFLEKAKASAKITIFDSPPTIVSDAAILASKVDGVLLVVKPGVTLRSTLQAVVEQLNLSGARILGVIFNHIPRNRIYYYGRYRHAFGYYYSGHHRYRSYYQNNSKTGSNGHDKAGRLHSIFPNLTKKPPKNPGEIEQEPGENEFTHKN